MLQYFKQFLNTLKGKNIKESDNVNIIENNIDEKVLKNYEITFCSEIIDLELLDNDTNQLSDELEYLDNDETSNEDESNEDASNENVQLSEEEIVMNENSKLVVLEYIKIIELLLEMKFQKIQIVSFSDDSIGLKIVESDNPYENTDYIDLLTEDDYIIDEENKMILIIK